MTLSRTHPIDESTPFAPPSAQPSAATPAAPSSPPSSDPDLQESLDALLRIAEQRAQQPEALLDLLRRIEQLHRSIQDGPFRSSLPSDRNGLFTLLSEMESSGGWPYIPRLQLRTFMDLLSPEPEAEP
ncbi:MAG: hypothetical protein QUV07_14405 [Cyanobium sp. CZS 25K]|nr:hypothetical protein [Cyanobium sp. CZS25K]